jgi:outer membrane protein
MDQAIALHLRGLKLVIKTTKTLLVATLLFTATAGLFHTPALAADENYKIAVVDMQTVLASYEKRKAKYDDLQKQVDSLQSGIDKMSKDIEAARKDYEERRATLTDEERVKLETKITNDYANYQNELQKNQRQIDGMEELVLNEVLKDIQEAIEKIATDNSYHLVLNKGKGPRGAVLYASNSIDITPRILEQLNK